MVMNAYGVVALCAIGATLGPQLLQRSKGDAYTASVIYTIKKYLYVAKTKNK